MLVTLLGMETLGKAYIRAKALFPIVVTLSGMVKLATVVHRRKASVPIVVMVHGRAKSTPVKVVLLIPPLVPKAAVAIATVGYPPSVLGIVIAPPAPV